jgi:hypothetical protein
VESCVLTAGEKKTEKKKKKKACCKNGNFLKDVLHL